MFTDENLQELHQDEKYKRSNNLFTNLKHSVFIVKNGNGYFSLSMSTSPNISLSVNLVKFLWFILKYFYITKELVDFRKKVLEYVLHDYYDSKFDFIRNFMNNSNKWIEYNDEKLLIIKNLCIEYLSDVNNRLIFIKYSPQNRERSERTLIETISLLDKLFEKAIHKSKFQQLFRLSYEYLLTNNTGEELQYILRNAMESGNLT